MNSGFQNARKQRDVRISKFIYKNKEGSVIMWDEYNVSYYVADIK